MGPDGEKDCLSGLNHIDWIREVSPNKVIKCRHRTYTEVERRFLDYIDGELERTCFSFFKLKSIDYGDEKHKFVFPSMSCDPLRVALWDEVENLTVPDSPPPPEILPENHRALELQKEREYRKIPQLEFDTPYGIKYSETTTAHDLERAKIRKRNYVKSTDEFKGWYTTLIAWTEKLRESSKVHGWTVIDEELFDEDWKPPKKAEARETLASLRAQKSALIKSNARLEKSIAKMEELNIAKKRKMNANGGPSKPVDNSAELARQVHQWKDLYSTECKVLKDEKMALQATLALDVKKLTKLQAELVTEKAAKNALQVDLNHQKQLHEAALKNLNDRIEEYKSDKDKYMEKVLGAPSASQSIRTAQINRLGSQDNTPTDARNDHGRVYASGSAHSPPR